MTQQFAYKLLPPKSTPSAIPFCTNLYSHTLHSFNDVKMVITQCLRSVSPHSKPECT